MTTRGWRFTWREFGRLQIKTVYSLRGAQQLEDELQARNIYASLERVKTAQS